MKTISRHIAKHIVQNTKHDVSENVIAYGLEIFLGESLKIVIFALLGWLLGCMIEVLIIVAVYAILRSTTGGSHCTSYMRCLFLGIATFIPLGILAKYIEKPSYLVFIILLSIAFTSYVTYKWVPGEWHGRKLKKTKEQFRKATFIIIAIIHVISLLILLVGSNKWIPIVAAIQLSALWQFVCVTPFGYRLIAFTDQLMIQITNIMEKRRESNV